MRTAVVGNDPVAEEAARDYMVTGGSAVGAILAGFFAAAGSYAGVLLGPVSILVGGVGAGVRAFDGRCRQPGLGTKRPRGFRPEDPIPDAARIAVPTAVAAALVAHAYDGSQKLGSILKAGIAGASRSGAPERADLLKRIRQVGATAMTEPGFVRPLLRLVGPGQGGLLTPTDLAMVPELDQPAVERTDRPGWFEAPWAKEGECPPEGSDLGIGCAICAVDVRGVFAVLVYRRLVDGFVIEDLELEAPFHAVPVERGVERMSPGAWLPAPAPCAVRHAAGTLVELATDPGALYLDAPAIESAPFRLRRDPETHRVDVIRS